MEKQAGASNLVEQDLKDDHQSSSLALIECNDGWGWPSQPHNLPSNSPLERV